MNCKPGDLAVIVRARCPENIGLIVVILSEWELDEVDGFSWLTESSYPTPTVWCDDGEPAGMDRQAFVPDAWMRPLRDLGDHARDETLSWLPSPVTEAA